MINAMKKILFVLISSTILLTSCSKFQRVLKSSDMNLKYETAEKYYLKKDYFRALQLLEELMTVYRGTARGEQVYYYYAYSNFYIRDYIMASYHFNNFLTSYPTSKYAEEIQYMYAYCFYLDSPVSSLDQTNSFDAINKFQLFINRYPGSERVADANKLIDELRMKLETKEFANAKLYYKTENYKAAVSALQNVLIDFPGTIFKEEALYLIFKSYYFYAINSVETKQLLRLKDARESYFRLVDAYPQSKYLDDAERQFSKVESEIKSLETVALSPQ